MQIQRRPLRHNKKDRCKGDCEDQEKIRAQV